MNNYLKHYSIKVKPGASNKSNLNSITFCKKNRSIDSNDCFVWMKEDGYERGKS